MSMEGMSISEPPTKKQEVIDRSFAAITVNKTVLEFLQVFSKDVPLRDALLLSDVRKQIHLALKNRQITSRLDGKKYIVYGIGWVLRPCSFYDSQARQISVTFEQHLKITYDVEVKEKDQPLIVVKYQGGNSPTYLLPELCGIVL